MTYNNEYDPKVSLINASKLGFDPINHTISNEGKDKWSKMNKQAPFSKFLHSGRINAPNYSHEYA